jgi:phytoene desaturase
MHSVLVVGAGVGGIATAARLAKQGCQVTVLEKNEGPGGRCGMMTKEGHRFDTGATLYLMPELYVRTFEDLDERLDDHLTLKRVDPTYDIHYSDGSRITLTSDLPKMQAQLESFEPGSFLHFLRYLDEGCRHYKGAVPHLVQREFRNPLEFFNVTNLVRFLRLKALVNHHKNLGSYFNDPRLKIAFSFQNLYMGLNPFKSPAIYSLMQYTEFADGIWYPMGGMYSIVEALVHIAEKWGVRFMYNHPVRKINISNNTTTGVTLENGKQINADTIITNADLPYAYKHLLPDNGESARLERKKYGCSAIVFYWGLDRQFPQLSAHNLLMAADYQESFDPIYNELGLPDDPNIYVHVPTCLDTSLAPEGHETLVVALPCGHIDESSPQDWDALQQKARNAVLTRLNSIGVREISEHIKFEVCYTPVDWQNRYNLVKGSTHGLSHNLMQMGYMRPKNRHARYKNLYFVGASTHPGTGLPCVLESARMAAERVMEESKVREARPALEPSYIA